jgi:cytidylate kinase
MLGIKYPMLINKVATLFQVREKATEQNPYTWGDHHSFTRPFITIAREPGSGGAPIASAVAKKLGFDCLDEKIIDEISKSTKLRRAVIKEVDEKTRSKVQDIVHSVLNPDYVDDLKYITELTKVVVTYALKGKVVIVGRGANFLTPIAKGLHVNISAPYEVRVQRAMQYEGFDREKAKQVIASVEKERKNFVKQYLRKDPTKINSYDLTLNTTFLNVDQARDVIIDAFYRKFPFYSRTAPLEQMASRASSLFKRG